jgi:hypothetical protein
MNTIAWVLTTAVLCLFIRISLATDSTKNDTAASNAAVQNMSPKQLTATLQKNKRILLDDSGEVSFA